MATKDKFKVSVSNDYSSRKVLSIAQFLGVDYNPAQLSVATNHAVDIQNIVYKDRMNQKRRGWEKLYQTDADTYYTLENGNYVSHTNEKDINGVFTFKDVNNNEYTVFHIGHLLYLATGLGQSSNFNDLEFTMIAETVSTMKVVPYELANDYSQAFHGYGRLFLLDGNNYYVLKVENGEFELCLVEDDDETYVPTTTIGITEVDSSVSAREVLDDVNMMTQWRKNKLVTGTFVYDGTSYKTTVYPEYKLDTAIVPKTATDINNIVVSVSRLETEEE